jgi:hypothetical protein
MSDTLFVVVILLLLVWVAAIIVNGATRILCDTPLVGLLVLIFLPAIFLIWAFFRGISG